MQYAVTVSRTQKETLKEEKTVERDGRVRGIGKEQQNDMLPLGVQGS